MNLCLLTNATIASCVESTSRYGLINNGTVAVAEGAVQWCGPAEQTPEPFLAYSQIDCRHKLLTPALIDCHTHLIHGGHRAQEFEQRLTGVSYADIAASGGGIVSTMRATRTATVDELITSALPRVDALLSEGVCVLEIKSGYGLDTETELNMLRAARALAKLRPVTIKTSFLGAHAVPEEYAGRADDYIDQVCIPTLAKAAAEGLVDAVDGFCESIAFTPIQIERVFKKAQSLALPIKLHAEQLSLLGGAQLAAQYNALSADHLEYLDRAGVEAMAKSNTVAVLLPGAFYTLHETQAPPVNLLREHGVAIAVATDCNPGSSPISSLLSTMNMACTLFKLTPEESLLGVTRHAAKALGLSSYGEISPGKRADFALWDCSHPAELSYRIGFNPLIERVNI